ncbi:TolC family protein [Dinghuibacter silviterrae]|uniref:Outer membrane protein TolC n=1 Tax=Dinghuibacter silviterrae TaxID=1539049 RepID=A0A4R8DGE9_9BACT|nr:TolC family protein [Dinghuibacter silviterrae]TDW96448.1 outer membrane protein TolC [Dinghuibacter silviterrae]
MLKLPIVFLFVVGATCSVFPGTAQVLTLKQAVQTALANYPTLKAKAHYVQSSRALVKEAGREYLPDLTVSAQQDYGTVNGQNGPLYSFTGLTAASSGPVFPDQNNAAAFGALYLANVNWNFFAFGRYKEKVAVARRVLEEDTSDLYQERFQEEIEVAGAYLNLLAAQQLIHTQESNLERAQAVQRVVLARVKGQLNPGVDSSQANAEVSAARIELTNAVDAEQQRANELAQLMGVPAGEFVLDTLFLSQVPSTMITPSTVNPQDHPLLKFYKSRIAVSDEETKYLKTYNYPTFSLFGLTQGRGSGFDYNYSAANPDAYTHSYGQGVGVQRINYLVGIGVTWNLTNPLRIHEQVAAQRFTSLGLGDEYELINQRLAAQRVLAETRITNALSNYREAPVQVKAAQDAFNQKNVLYNHGLANILDLTQTQYVLNRAEIDRDIAYNNVWQALLLKAAATGDWDLFITAF